LYPETTLLKRVVLGILSCTLAEALSEQISDELPGLVRLIGLHILGTALSNGENSQRVLSRQ